MDAPRVIGLLISSWEAFSARRTDEGGKGNKPSTEERLMINLSEKAATRRVGWSRRRDERRMSKENVWLARTSLPPDCLHRGHRVIAFI